MGIDEFDIDVSEYEGVDIERIASEEAFRAAINTQNEWRDNLDQGVGAAGSHGRQYRNTGEAINDITISPQSEGASEYLVGGDVVQLAVAEWGAVFDGPPPFEPIADWAGEKGLNPEEGQTFEEMVNAIRWGIAEHGLEGFAPGRAAAKEVGPTYEENVIERLNEQIEENGD